jgi:hypothetical protein
MVPLRGVIVEVASEEADIWERHSDVFGGVSASTVQDNDLLRPAQPV